MRSTAYKVCWLLVEELALDWIGLDWIVMVESDECFTTVMNDWERHPCVSVMTVCCRQ